MNRSPSLRNAIAARRALARMVARLPALQQPNHPRLPGEGSA